MLDVVFLEVEQSRIMTKSKVGHGSGWLRLREGEGQWQEGTQVAERTACRPGHSPCGWWSIQDDHGQLVVEEFSKSRAKVFD